MNVAGAESLSTDEAALIWRVAQETVRNALGHAHAPRLWITLTTGAKSTVFELADDGVGFDAAGTAPTDHLGLRLVDDIARSSGATLQVDSTSGASTVVRLEVPHL